MKTLIVGGVGQGKLERAKNHYGRRQIMDGGVCSLEEAFAGDALDGLHRLVRRLMEAGEEPMAWVSGRLKGRKSWTILCDEVGSGVVPVDGFEREWREQVGRLCCHLAADAQVVERLCCGIPQRLKG